MRLLREPLFHFLVLGTVLFLIYAVLSDIFTSDANRRIEVTRSEIQLLAETWQRQWHRPPTEEELRGLVQSRVREEVLYREALAVGLDQNDLVVRRRMVQKMELLSQDLATLADPTDQELREFFQERQEEYRVPPRISFSHVYFNPDRRGAAVEEEARRVLEEIRAMEPSPRSASELGDRFMLPHDYVLLTPLEVQQQFGARFSEVISELEPGWHGPIVSGYGLHLVNVRERSDGRIPDYAEIRERLVVDYNRARSERAKNALYEGLATEYEVEIEEEAIRSAALKGGPR